MDKTYLKSILFNVLGAVLLGLGCLLYLSANIGSDAMTTFSQGISVITNLSFSLCYYGLNVIMMIIAIIMDRKQIGWGTIIFPAVAAVTIQVGSAFIPLTTGWLRYPVFILGLILISFAVALASKAICGKNPNDAMNFAIMKKVNKDYSIVRSSVDAIMLIAGILLHGTWGIGTVLAVVLTGVIASKFMKVLDKIMKVN